MTEKFGTFNRLVGSSFKDVIRIDSSLVIHHNAPLVNPGEHIPVNSQNETIALNVNVDTRLQVFDSHRVVTWGHVQGSRLYNGRIIAAAIYHNDAKGALYPLATRRYLKAFFLPFGSQNVSPTAKPEAAAFTSMVPPLS